MSSGLAENTMETYVPTVDDEAYETPTYDEAFPPMAGGGGDMKPQPSGASHPVNMWQGKKMAVRSSMVTQVRY